MISLHWKENYATDHIGYCDMSHSDDLSSFELSEFLKFDEWIEEDYQLSVFPAANSSQTPVYRAHVIGESGVAASSHHEGPSITTEEGRETKEVKERVAFKTKSEVEILDDGFKWRKYGKKMVKNSPNPRNYYRCWVEGCPVKKRVERDREEQEYVITTYEGVHNHPTSS